jgi:pilus assembly protein Flp/PilA
MFTSIRTMISNVSRDEQGATAIEYGLIAALISIIAIPGMLMVGPRILAAFTDIAGNM